MLGITTSRVACDWPGCSDHDEIGGGDLERARVYFESRGWLISGNECYCPFHGAGVVMRLAETACDRNV